MAHCKQMAFIAGFFSCVLAAQAATIVFDRIPTHLQLFPRDSADSSQVVISGRVTSLGSNSVSAELYKNDSLWKSCITSLAYTGSSADFSMNFQLYSELAEYKFRIHIDDSLVTERDSITCGDIYLLNGQSNTRATDFQGLATFQSEWIRSYSTSGSAVSVDSLWGLAQGHIDHTHAAVGVWGLLLGKRLVETYGIPVCILNGAVGGTTIAAHLRNESNRLDVSTIYGRLLYRASKAGIEQNVKAIIWHQGENNTDATYAAYAASFHTLYDAWKEDYLNLKKMYVFQIRPGCGFDFQNNLREIQRTLPESYDDIEIMSTNGIVNHDGCHYGCSGYDQMAEWIFGLVAHDFYNSTDTIGIRPPNIQRAYYTTGTYDRIALEFDQPIVWPSNYLGNAMKNYMYIDGAYGAVDSGYVQDSTTVILNLSASSNGQRITYLPNWYYNGTATVFEGPWIRNPRGIGALSFFDFPIADSATTDIHYDEDTAPAHFRTACYPNPFNPVTTIAFSVSQTSTMRISVYDFSGRHIETLFNGPVLLGEHHVQWNAGAFASGLYVYRIQRNGKLVETRRICYLK